MEGEGKAFYAFCYIGLIAIHVAAIVYLGSVPGAELAKELLS